MTLMMNQLLDSKLTETVDEGDKVHESTQTQEEDTMVLWDFVSMFGIEDEGQKVNEPTQTQ